MTDFLNSVKADLLDRRVLPLVVVVLVGLACGLAYVVVGAGSSSSGSSGPRGAAPSGPPAGVSVSQVSAEKAVAETTGGVSQQYRKGTSSDPFKPLPEAKKATVKAATASTPPSNASTPSPASETSSPSTGESGAPAPPQPPAKPKPVYHVAVLFGPAPPEGSAGTENLLTPYENVKLLTPLPSASQALIVFRGVTAGGKSATFTLVSEAILQGPATCLPSASQCQSIELKPGQQEVLEYISTSGQAIVYDLQLVNITVSKGSSSKVESALRGESKAGRVLLAHEGLTQLPGLRYSAQQGVLVLVKHASFGGRTHQHHRR